MDEFIIINSLSELIDNLKNHLNTNLNQIDSLLTFFRNVSEQYALLSTSIKIPQNTKIYHKKFQDFFKIHNKFLENLLVVSSNLKSEIIFQLETFYDDIKKKSEKNIEDLNNIIQPLIEQKNIIIKKKQEYYIENEKSEKIENEIVKDINKTKNDLDNAHKILYNQRDLMEVKLLSYKEELNKINKLIHKSEMDFIVIVGELNVNEDEINNKCNQLLDIYLKIVNNLKDFPQELTKIKNQIKVNEKNNYFENLRKNNHLFSSGWEKIELISYSQFKKSKFPYQNKKKIVSKNIIKSNDLIQLLINNKIYDYTNCEENENYEKQEYNEILNVFFSGLLIEKSLQGELLNKIIDILNLNSNYEFYKYFLTKFLQTQNKVFFEFSKFSNLAHFNNILINILSNICFNLETNENNTEIFLAIIKIGEKTFCNDIYMCSLLSKSKFFKDKNIWKILIKYKLILKLNEFCENESIKNQKNKLLNKGIKLGSFLINRVTNKASPILEKLNFHTNLKKYSELTFEQIKKLNEFYFPNYLHSVLKEFILIMNNYNFPINEIKDIIIENINMFHVNKNYLSYYLLYLDISKYSIRKKLPNSKEKYSKIKEIIEKKIYFININYPCEMQTEKEKIIILKNISKYLNNKDIINLLSLKKSVSMKLNKKIFKNILLSNNISLKKHLQIWKSILHINNYKKKYNYKNLLNNLNLLDKKISNLIDLDIRRTSFKKNKETGRKAIDNILKCFALNEKNLNYCQGMNHICAFIYDLFENEEECFYLFISLMNEGKYYEIFSKNYQILNTYFFVLEKLILLFLPEIYMHFKENQAAINTFSSSYFITLFTNLYYVNLNENYDKVIIKIWDDFLLSGWKSIFITILCMLDYHKYEILEYKNDDLINFLINKLNNSDLFKNENYNKFIEIKKTIKIKKSLLNNLNEAFKMDNKIKQTQMINENNNLN